MSKTFVNTDFTYNNAYAAKIRLFAKNKCFSLKEAFIPPLVNLYEKYNGGAEFSTNNQELEAVFNCKKTKTKKITQYAELVGILKKERKSRLIGNKLHFYLQCTLARLPELASTNLGISQKQNSQDSKNHFQTDRATVSESLKIKVAIQQLADLSEPPFGIIKSLCEHVEKGDD